MRHGALLIGFQNVFECLLRRSIPERMLIQHALVEQLLRGRRAGRFEVDFAQLLVVG
jgi:hypothetical protein